MKFYRVFAFFFLCFCIAFTFVFGAKKINEGKSLSTNSEYTGILTLWHVETFEGGEGSRRQFLLKIAREFEKEYPGLLVYVTTHTANSLKENFSKQIYPDIISYGNGIEVQNLVELYGEFNCVGGMFGDKILAIPWCRGGYFLIDNPLIKNDNNDCLVSNSEFNVPILALMGFSEKLELKESSQYGAYLEFVNGKCKYLLGTQRDIVRLTNIGMNFNATPIETFNDLYQYVSIIRKDDLKVNSSRAFVEYLLSERSQKKLNSINMFSDFFDVEFDVEIMSKMQKIKKFSTISSFNSAKIFYDLKELSLGAYSGNDEKFIKLKKFII